MIALITGATSGIGEATAIQFAKNGYDVIITGRRKERLEKLESKLKQNNIKVLSLCFDVRNYEEVKNSIASIPNKWRTIQVLINNAGLASGLGTLENGLLDDWEKMIDTNLKGLLYVTKEVIPLLKTAKQAQIINIGSIAGKEVYANGNVYCSTKHAVDALNKALRIELLPHGIKVTAIHPGMVETEFSIVRFHGDEDRAKKVYEGLIPLYAEDIAETIYWVASRPDHVNINELTIMPKAQANSTTAIRNN
jgi:NADP-dependent 3-hydroxy acid dehydrogenase YdfG